MITGRVVFHNHSRPIRESAARFARARCTGLPELTEGAQQQQQSSDENENRFSSRPGHRVGPRRVSPSPTGLYAHVYLRACNERKNVSRGLF